MLGNPRQGKARLRSTGLGWAWQGNARQEKAMKGRAMQDKAMTEARRG